MKYAIICSHVGRKFLSQRALSNINLSLPRKGFIGILGSSGSGKSTLLNILSGIDNGYQGEALILNKNIKRLSDAERGAFRLRHIGYVFQSFALLENETALQNVYLAVDCVSHARKAEKRRKAADLLRFVGLEDFKHQRVNKLSGGQKQRVAIARALANDPKIILADEPSGSLDEASSELVFDLLGRIAKKALVLVVTHDETLARRKLDEGYFLKDGKLVAHETFIHPKNEMDAPSSMRFKEKEGHVGPGFRYLFAHAFSLLRAKKYRSLFSLASITLGLVGVGLSNYMTSSIQDELSSAFSTIVPENVLTLSPATNLGYSLSNIYAAKEEDASFLAAQYPDYIKGTGASIQIGYESWFTDANMFTYISGATQQVLPGFSSRTINDFLWLEDYPTQTFFPHRIDRCGGWDEVVLGIPFSTMNSLCYGLHIPRTFQSLGDFVGQRKLQLILDIARYEWEFEDSELFTVIGVTETRYPCFFHSDPYWNRHFFLDHLKFRSWLNEETPNPQYALELPYLSLKAPFEEVLPLLRKEETLDHLIYEMPSSYLLPSICPAGQTCSVNRLYLYGADKQGCHYGDLDEIMLKNPKIIGRTPVTQGAYYADSDSVAMGFTGKFFLCESEEKAHSIVDLYSDLPIQYASLMLDTIDGTIDGSYLSSASSGLRLSCDLSHIEQGRAPVGLEEIAISSSLDAYMGHPEYLYVASETAAEEIGENLSRTFGVAKLKVVGVKPSRNKTMYVPSDWAVDFFQIHLGMSAFALQPTGCVYYLDETADPKALQMSLMKDYPQYRFGSPKEDVEETMSSTLSYLGVMLSAFSLIAVTMSGLLLFVVLSIQMKENQKEDAMFYVLGISKADIAKSYACHCVIYTGIGMIIASIFLVIIEIFVKQYIASAFGGAPSNAISLSPLLTMFIAAIAFAVLISLCLSLSLSRKNFSLKDA